MCNFSDGLSLGDFDGFGLTHVARRIVFLEEVSSTNDYAKELAQKGEPSGAVVVAGKQLQGKGRLGRNWDGGQGKDIYMSIIIRPPADNVFSENITLLAGLCAANGINDFLPQKNAVIKWPNDVVANGKKLCGILAESGSDYTGAGFIVLGIGINVNRESFPEELLEKASSLYILTGSRFKRSQIIKKLLAEFDRYYTEFLEKGASSFMPDYRNKCVNQGKAVLIVEGGREYKATAIGVTDDGLLEVKKENGGIAFVRSGEVSVRGIYGYV